MAICQREQIPEDLPKTGAPRRLLRHPEVEARTGLSRSSIYERMAEGTFPRQVPLSPGSVAWLEEEVEAWIEARLTDRNSTTEVA